MSTSRKRRRSIDRRRHRAQQHKRDARTRQPQPPQRDPFEWLVLSDRGLLNRLGVSADELGSYLGKAKGLRRLHWSAKLGRPVLQDVFAVMMNCYVEVLSRRPGTAILTGIS